MKKTRIFSASISAAILAGCFTGVSAGAAETINDFSYSLVFSEVPAAGDTAQIKDAEDNTVMTVTYLGGEWKASGAGIAPNANADRPTVSSGNYAAGCAIQFAPEKNGEVLVDRKLGSGKTMKIDENGKNILTLTNSAGGSISTKDNAADFTIDVEAGNTYIAYATGTGDPFYGIYFEPASSSAHTLSGAINYSGSEDTSAWKLVFTDTKDGSTYDVPFAGEYSVELTQNRRYDIALAGADGAAPENTCITLDTNSVYVGKEDVSFDINVVDIELTDLTGDVVVHDVYNDGSSLDLSKVELTFTANDDASLTYKTAITDNKIALKAMPNHTYTVTASGNDGYTLSPLSGEYTMPAGDMSPFKNILFTEEVNAVDFKAAVEVGADKEFARINDAITAIKNMQRPAGEEGRVTVLIDPGTYTEQVTVDDSYITIKAADEANKPVIEWYYGIGYLYYSSAGDGFYSEDYAVAKTKKGPVDRWGSAFRVGIKNNKPAADYVNLENIIVRHTFNIEVTDAELADGVEAAMNNEYSDTNGKPDRTVEGYDAMSQTATERAAAITIDGNYSDIYNCEFISSQDTFYTDKTAYVKNCYIEGGTDFIFGGSSVVFDDCTLAWHGYSGNPKGGYLTANKNGSAPGTGITGNGYLFRNCTVTNSKYFPDNEFLPGSWGRNWGGKNTQVVYDGIKLDGIDAPGAWVNMPKDATLADSTLYVANVTDKDGNAVDAAAYNPNGTMEDNGYTEMAPAEYFGGWTPVHYIEEGIEAVKITAEYDESNRLKGVSYEPYIYSGKIAAEKDKTIFVWNSIDGMEPLCEKIEYTEPEATEAPAGGLQAVSAAATWDASFWTESAGTYTEDAVLGTLAVNGVTADKAITIEAGKRLKFGGTGSASVRNISILPAVDGTLVIDFVHASGTPTDERELGVSQSGAELGTAAVNPDATSNTLTVTVKSGSQVYVYSKRSGINITKMTFTPSGN